MMLPFLRARTEQFFNHSGIYITETHTLFGAYDVCDYGTAAKDRGPDDLNPGLEDSQWIGLDFAGDAGLPELSVMLLDFYAHTNNDEKMSSYLPLLSETLEFFYQHYARDQQGYLSVFPTQALETYWCLRPNSFENCPVNDAPTISALHVLTRRALQLPNHITSESQRTMFTKLQEILPDVPITTDPQSGARVVSPFEQYPAAQSIHNSETPELYVVVSDQ